MKLLLIIALSLPPVAIAASGDQLAMGPDPGGHTGATVTPESTRTDRKEVDEARKAASGDRTETNTPENDRSKSRDDKDS